jgi:4-phytase/acid phosphatase
MFRHLCLAVLAVLPTPLIAAPVLERVVMVSRHGVRAPLRSVALLESLTKRGWPAWPVAPGDMTPHGAQALALMGDYLRRVYVGEGALPAAGCPAPGTVAVWSDVADRRTRESGDILAARFAPGCGLVATHAPTGTADPVFDATQSKTCPVGFFKAAQAVLAAARASGGLIRPEDRRSLEVLQGILAPDACRAIDSGICLVPDAGATTVTAAAKLGLGAMIAEGLYLEYVQGFPAQSIGWGKAGNAATIAAIIPAHGRDLDIRRRTDALAARRGAVMARTILALLEARALPAGAPPLPGAAKVVMFAGHDSNLLYMGALMGLDWQLPNQPSVTAPDTTLAFEVWRDPATATRTLRVVVYAQTLDQLREATPLVGTEVPDVVPIVPDACASSPGPCKVETFTAAVERDLAALCGG